MPDADRLVRAALDGARLPALVITDGVVTVAPMPRVSVMRAGDPRPDAPARTAVLVAADRSSFRRAAGRLGALGTAREVGVVLLAADAVVPLPLNPSWPRPTGVDARLVEGGAVTRVELAARARTHAVLAAMATACVPARFAGHEGVRVAPSPSAYDPEADVPPDVVLGATGPLPVSPVTGRAPVAVPDDAAPLDEGVLDGVPADRSVAGWRLRLAAQAGVRCTPYPSVSVVTDDPGAWADQVLLPGVELETVATVDDARHDVVLLAGVGRRPGPAVVTELLLARRHSGSDERVVATW